MSADVSPESIEVMSQIVNEDVNPLPMIESPARHAAASPARVEEERAPGRVAFIDVTRGILILMMTSSHALAQAHVPASSFFYSSWWLPQGWSTAGFIALSGFTVALLIGTPEQAGRMASRRIARAGELLAIMVVSNVLFRTARVALGLYDAEDLDWSHLVLPAHANYSISGVLLPTAMLLVLSAFILPVVHRVRLPLVVGTLLACAFGVSLLSYLAVRSVWGDPLTFIATINIGDFPVVPLVGCGLLGLSAGLLWQRLLSQRTIIAITIVLALVPALPLLPESPVTVLTHQTLIGLSHLVALLGLAFVLLSVRAARPIVRALSVVGQYALFCFLAHRLLLGIAVASHVKTVLRPEVLYSIYVASTMAALIAVCTLRNAWPALDRGLRSIYL